MSFHDLRTVHVRNTRTPHPLSPSNITAIACCSVLEGQQSAMAGAASTFREAAHQSTVLSKQLQAKALLEQAMALKTMNNDEEAEQAMQEYRALKAELVALNSASVASIPPAAAAGPAPAGAPAPARRRTTAATAVPALVPAPSPAYLINSGAAAVSLGASTSYTPTTAFGGYQVNPNTNNYWYPPPPTQAPMAVAPHAPASQWPLRQPPVPPPSAAPRHPAPFPASFLAPAVAAATAQYQRMFTNTGASTYQAAPPVTTVPAAQPVALRGLEQLSPEELEADAKESGFL